MIQWPIFIMWPNFDDNSKKHQVYLHFTRLCNFDNTTIYLPHDLLCNLIRLFVSLVQLITFYQKTYMITYLFGIMTYFYITYYWPCDILVIRIWLMNVENRNLVQIYANELINMLKYALNSVKYSLWFEDKYVCFINSDNHTVE